jgi:plasmid stability protein
MGVLLQVKDLPEETHRVLKARAALAGVSLSEYARRTLTEAASRPSREELLAQLERTPVIETSESTGDALARIRDDLA